MKNNHDSLIRKIVWKDNKPTKYWYNLIKYQIKYKNLQQYLKDRYIDSESKAESIYRIVFNIEKRPVCISCGKHVNFCAPICKLGFRKYCSNECASKSPQLKEKIKEACIKKYGVEYAFKAKEVKDKIRNTCLKKYGKTTWNQTKEGRKKMSIISSSDEVQNKIKNTNLERYGDTNWMKTDFGRKRLSEILSSDEIRQKK